MTTLSSREHWFKSQRSNSVLPLQLGSKRQESSSNSKNYGSPVKRLIPSISTFNVPPDNETPAVAETPPPQFAVENEARRFRFRRRKEIVKGYPSAFETYLFDDATPGVTSKGIQPVRLLIERLEAWCLLSKRLLHHFEVLASVETRVAKNYRKLERVMIFPNTNTTKKLHYRHERILQPNHIEDRYPSRLLQIHFAFTGGIRGVCDAWQTYHTDASKDHSEFATFLRSEAIPTLSNIKRELKWMIKSIRGDDRLSLGKLTTLKEEAARRLKRLDRQLVFFNEHPYHGYCKVDPWLMNAGVVKQMIKVYHQENKVHETVLRLQREILISEEQLVEEFRRLCQHVYSMRENSTLGIDKGLESIMQTFNSVTMDSDWSNFCQQNSEHLVPENAAFRHPDHLQYPNHSHPLLQPIFSARMERRSPLLNRWQEYIYVLTPAGFLHEYHNGRNYPSNPDTSIFVPHYKVSSLSTNLHHNLVFQLQPHKASRNLLSDQGHPTILPKEWRTSKSRLGINDRFTWALRAKSAADMDQWIHHLTQVSNRYTATNVSIPLHMPSHEMTVPVITSVAEINDAQEEKAKEESQATEEEGNNIQETPVEDTPSTSAEDAVPTEEDQAEKPSETETAADVEKPAEEAKEESATDVKDEKPGDDKKEDKSEEEKKPDEEEKKSEGEKKPTEEEKKSDEEKPAEDAVPAKEDEPSDPKTTD